MYFETTACVLFYYYNLENELLFYVVILNVALELWLEISDSVEECFDKCRQIV